MNRGKLVIGGIFLVSIAAATAGILLQHHSAKRSTALWGSDDAKLILQAAQVELLKYEGDAKDAVFRREITKARGLSYVRRGLVTDNSFDWDRPPGECDTGPLVELRFFDDRGAASVMVRLDCEAIWPAGREQSKQSIGPIAAGLREFFNEQLPKEHKLPAATDKQ